MTHTAEELRTLARTRLHNEAPFHARAQLATSATMDLIRQDHMPTDYERKTALMAAACALVLAEEAL